MCLFSWLNSTAVGSVGWFHSPVLWCHTNAVALHGMQTIGSGRHICNPHRNIGYSGWLRVTLRMTSVTVAQSTYKIFSVKTDCTVQVVTVLLHCRTEHRT